MKYATINFNHFQLEKWKWNQDKNRFLVTFNAPTVAGPWPERYTKEIDIEALQPDRDLWDALNKLKHLVCRGMDWKSSSDRLSRIVIVGIELKRKLSDGFELFISFEHTSENTGITAIFKKGVVFTSADGLKHSIDDLDEIFDILEEIRLFVAREKGVQGDLFSNNGASNNTNSETKEVRLFKN